MRIQRWLSLGLAVASLAVGLPQRLLAQGITTGAITGLITDANSAPMAAVAIEVVNRANGARASQVSRDNGRFFIQNLEVGTYTVTARRIGFAQQTRNDVVVTLTQSTRIDFRLTEQAAQLATVRTEASQGTSEFSGTRQGAQTVISDTLIRRLPTLNRDITDLIRNSPQVTVNQNGRISAAGQNNRFNNIQVDGVSLANRFGLGDSPTLGAQVNGRALPLDAIKEFQVLLSPYDVRQGNFTGALVNAVTQSGTNDFKGSAFIFYRDQELGRDTSFLRDAPFVRRQLGFSLGGPIIKDKLRFFATVETSANDSPVSGPFFNPTAPTGLVNSPNPLARVTQAQVDSFTTRLASFGIAPGNLGQQTLDNPLLNTFARLDYQLSENTRVVLRNIYNDQESLDFNRSLANLNFSSNAFRRTEKSNQIVGQVFTNFSNGWSNEFTLGLTNTRFAREPQVSAPQVLVQNLNNVQNVGFRAGTENNSQGNSLREDLIELQNNLTLPLGNHIVSIGTRNELYTANNSFLQNSFGNFTFNSLADFVSGARPASFSGSGGLGGDVVANFRALQLGGYIQDQWAVTPSFTTTLGLRIDVPIFLDKPSFSSAVQSAFGRSTSDIPSGNLQFSPRIGVNWDVTGDQRNQLRGGAGLFQGVPAFVWLSNQFQNTGAGLAQITCGGGVSATNGVAPLFTGTPVSPRGCDLRTGGQPGRSLDDGSFLGAVNLADENLKFPQLFRATLGYDRALPFGVIGTFEGLYSRSINNLFYRSINIPQAGRIDAQGRTVFSTIGANGIPVIAPLNPVFGNNVIELSNQSRDYSYSLTSQLRKRFDRALEGSVAYTYGRSFSVSDLTSSVAVSNFQFGRTFSGLQSDLSLDPSVFDQPHRLLINGTYTAPWKSNQTSVTFFYSMQSGTPYTLTFGGLAGRGDLNGDGSNANDPIYIPTGPTDPLLVFVPTTGTNPLTAAAQAASFDRIINDNECLASQRGRILARNSCRNPAFTRFDVTFEQQLPSIGGERATLRLDIFNAANLLNRNWGIVRAATANSSTVALAVLGLTSADPATQVPNVNFTGQFNPTFAQLRNDQFYQLQASLRLAF